MNQGDIARGYCMNCGKKEGGLIGSSEWGHHHVCCSDDCGKELGKKLDKFYKSKKYKKLQKAVNKAESKVAKACYKSTGVEARTYTMRE